MKKTNCFYVKLLFGNNGLKLERHYLSLSCYRDIKRSYNLIIF